MRSGSHQPLGVRLVGRLPALALLLALGCDGDKKDVPLAPKSRSQAVAGTGSPPAETAAPQPSAPKPPKVRRKLCDGQLAKAGRAMPTTDIGRAAAPGVAEPGDQVPVGAGKWTWVNFWAAWCVPCKEEMPRLIRWEKKLAEEGKGFRLVFVSLDDDPRQLEQFLKSQPAGGVQSTLWLREGKQREDWLSAVEMDTDPELPAHLIVDPSGKARCVVNGAVEDEDYEQVAALVRG